jgi:hypothetical protein
MKMALIKTKPKTKPSPNIQQQPTATRIQKKTETTERASKKK